MSNDVIAAVFGMIGVLFLIFAYVWYLKTIKSYPTSNKNSRPVIIYREIK